MTLRNYYCFVWIKLRSAKCEDLTKSHGILFNRIWIKDILFSLQILLWCFLNKLIKLCMLLITCWAKLSVLLLLLCFLFLLWSLNWLIFWWYWLVLNIIKLFLFLLNFPIFLKNHLFALLTSLNKIFLF